ncbi:MAG: hypothetical protein A2340_01500 [Lentisphaerae bacterium RIFOXYB12_FULL_60_10]|nr:MAG: hypothetical protein A2340_01500 [Lentisphaerae bacterium RIFOXYB12_FULL_60_10]
MERVAYRGWKNNLRLANREVELIVTLDVGPRIVRFGRIGGPNLFAEMKPQMGGTGEKEWMIRGGHRLWLAPEAKPQTYELDNEPVRVQAIPGGARVIQPRGVLTGVRRSMDIRLDPRRNRVQVVHHLKHEGRRTLRCAPWALTVMARNGQLVIPLPGKIPHTDRLTHNQEWSIWGYTDFSDPRWTLGSKYVFFRQDPKRGPNKLGVAHREGWVAYQVGSDCFVKWFNWKAGAAYPDGGVNFETFSNQDFLEIESLGALVDLAPGRTITHSEVWDLVTPMKAWKSATDVDRNLLPVIRRAKPAIARWL